MRNVKEILTREKRNMNGTHSDVNEHRHHHGNHGSIRTGNSYQCPMKCEGEKTYEKPGDCPVCNMHLMPVTEIHQSRHHYHCC